jgi:hypothetical protein
MGQITTVNGDCITKFKELENALDTEPRSWVQRILHDFRIWAEAIERCIKVREFLAHRGINTEDQYLVIESSLEHLKQSLTGFIVIIHVS